MTALAPSYLYATADSTTVTSPSTLGALGFSDGDLLVIAQWGQGSGTATPVPPTINGSSSGFTDGAYPGGTDIFIATATGAQRGQIWSKILSSGDLAFSVTVDKTGYSGTFHRLAIGKLSHADGFDSSRVFQTLYEEGGTTYGAKSIAAASWASGVASIRFSAATIYSVGDLVQVEGMSNAVYNGWFVVTAVTTTTVSNDTIQYSLPTNPGGSSSGATVTKVLKFNDPTRPACAFVFSSFISSGVAITSNIDGALSGSNYHRAPYFNSSGSSTQTDAVHGHHYSTNTVIAQGDYQEYDSGDTPLGFTINNNMSNSNHSIVVVLYQTAAAPNYLNGKLSNAISMKGDLQGGANVLNGKFSNALNMKGDIFTGTYLSGKSSNVSDIGAPNGFDSSDVPGIQFINGKISNASSMKGDLQIFVPSYLSGKISNAVNARAVLDFGSINPITGLGYNLVWDKVGERSYQRGLDRGVLYLSDGKAVPWNGLTEIVEKSTISSSPVYYDGMKIGESFELGSFEGTLKAITYPEEFAILDGSSKMRPGIFVASQRPKAFNLSYRTLLGNDADPDAGYNIHILYNVTAVPSDITNSTMTDSISIDEFQWDIVAIPEEIPGFAPTAHFIFDSTKTDPWLLENIESLLYGNGNVEPNLPSLEDLANFISEWYRIEIVDNGDGTWTAIEQRPGYIFPGVDGYFEIHGINGVSVDSDTYIISNT